MGYKIDNPGNSVTNGKQPGAITPTYTPSSEISNPQELPSNRLSAGASRMGPAIEEIGPESNTWAPLGNNSIDAAIRGMVDADKHPLTFAPIRKVKP